MKAIWSPSVSCRTPRKPATATSSAAWRSPTAPTPRTGGPLRGEAGPRARRGLPRLRGVLLEQRHVYVPRQKNTSELAKFRPDILEACRAAVNAADNGSDFISIPHDIFCECPDESVDYAVMEKTADAVVVGLDADWSDVGSGPPCGRSARKTGRVTSSAVTRGCTTAKTATSTATRSWWRPSAWRTGDCQHQGRRAGDEPRAFP